MALADGLFIASQVDDVALDQAFSLMATAILRTAQRLRDSTWPQPSSLVGRA